MRSVCLDTPLNCSLGVLRLKGKASNWKNDPCGVISDDFVRRGISCLVYVLYLFYKFLVPKYFSNILLLYPFVNNVNRAIQYAYEK